MKQRLDERRITCLVLLGVATVCAALSAVPGLSWWEVQMAGTLERLRPLIADAAAVRRAVAWDFGLLLSYGLLLGFGATGLGTLLSGRWERLGAWAGCAALGASAFDAVENAALLHALEGRAWGAPLQTLAACLKWALLAFALTSLGLLALKWFTSKPTPLNPMGRPTPLQTTPPRLECDVVMKGGITSGIVYPRAVSELATAYRFVNLGGSSAGAIAAGAAAAAEYGRYQGLDSFSVLAGLPAWLGEGGRLLALFRPSAAMRGPFAVLTSFLGPLSLPLKAVRALLTAMAWFPLAGLLALVPPGLLGLGAFLSDSPAWALTAVLFLASLLLPLALALGVWLRLSRALPGNGYGLSTGHVEDDATVLCQWLHQLLADLSGVASRPLTFGDLWEADQTPVALAAAGSAPRGRGRCVNFEALTTSLSEGRPYRMPDSGRHFFFRREDLSSVFPKTVIDWMVDHPDGPSPEAGYHSLPAAKDLPVLVAVRLSLSFPFLLSAVRLWTVDHTESHQRLAPCWLSDGGIASNFPIHFFDSLVPTRPTFGLDLGPFHPSHPRQADESANVFLPLHNNSGHATRVNAIGSVGSFAKALVNAMQAFLDNMQMRTAGYRDRVARIFLDAEEGGMNLNMPPTLLQRLGDRGAVAGQKLVAHFAMGGGPGWRNHRWVRLRSLLAMLQPMLRDFRLAMADPSWRELVEKHEAYPLNEQQKRAARDLIDALERMGDPEAANLAADAPMPSPELRGAPRV